MLPDAGRFLKGAKNSGEGNWNRWRLLLLFLSLLPRPLPRKENMLMKTSIIWKTQRKWTVTYTHYRNVNWCNHFPFKSNSSTFLPFFLDLFRYGRKLKGFTGISGGRISKAICICYVDDAITTPPQNSLDQKIETVDSLPGISWGSEHMNEYGIRHTCSLGRVR